MSSGAKFLAGGDAGSHVVHGEVLDAGNEILQAGSVEGARLGKNEDGVPKRHQRGNGADTGGRG